MPNLLQTVLQIDSPLFNAGLQKLEQSTGHSAVDVRLIADITSIAHKKMRLMKLDPADTTARELYHALMTAAKTSYIEQLFADSDYVLLLIDEEIVSLNLIDIIECRHHELTFEKRITKNGQRSLMGELIARYVGHARTNEQVVREIAISIGILEVE